MFCRWLCISICPSVCHRQIKTASSFLFLDGIEPFFGHQFSVIPSTKSSLISDLGPLMPKIWTKIAYKLACMADRLEMFAPTRGFLGMADSMEPCKMLWGQPCCRGNDIWPRHGDLVTYWLVYITYQIVGCYYFKCCISDIVNDFEFF